MDLRTKDIKISNENPFEHDLLKRDKYVNNLTQIVKNTKGGFTLSINADWGYGKTTFVKMWEASLQNEGYKTIYFNAWETDFVADPMMALIDGLRDGFESADLPQEKLQKLSALWDVMTFGYEGYGAVFGSTEDKDFYYQKDDRKDRYEEGDTKFYHHLIRLTPYWKSWWALWHPYDAADNYNFGRKLRVR
jgi:hypothetical protein